MTLNRIFTLAACFISISSIAQESSLDSQRLSEVVVTDQRSNNIRVTDVGKLPAMAKDLPMSITIIDRGLLERQQALRIDDALQNVPGVYLMGTTGGYQQEIAGRGYAFNSSNTFKNGVRYNNMAMPEITGLERIEVLKGSAAVLYGNVAAGGILNLVTKKPLFSQGGEVGFRAGSYDFYKPYVDVYGPVAGSRHVAYRLNTTFEQAGSYRDDVKSERMYVNPSLLIRAGKKTDVLIEGDYLKDTRTLDYGTGAVNYVIADVPRERFLGAAWSYAKLEQQSATITTTHRLNAAWQLRNISGLQDFSSDVFGTTRPNNGTLVQPDGKFLRGIQRSGIREQYYSTQLDLTGHMATGAIGHTLLFGVDADAYNTATTAYNTPAKYDSVNIYDLTKYQQRADIPSVSMKTITTAPINRYGIYAQDLLAIGKHLKLLAGIRYSHQQTGSDIKTIATDSTVSTATSDGAFTPRFGLVYQPTSALNFFASYSNAFTLNTGLDIYGNALPPSYISQYEAGAKMEIIRHLLSANASLYRIINSNLAQMSLQNGNSSAEVKELAGEVTSEGAELELQSRVWHGLSALGGYSYNETKYTKSNTYVEGSRLRYNPNHTANFNLYYQFRPASRLNGFNLVASWYYVGNRVAGRSTRVQVGNDAYRLMEIPDYASFDAGIGYSYRGLSLRLKVSNIADVLSYNVHDDNSIIPIPPRQFAATVGYKF